MCMQVDAYAAASRTSDLFLFSLPRTSLGFSPFSTLCTASLELNWRYTIHNETYITHVHAQSSYNATVQIHITLSLIVGCNHGREKDWSYRHQGYKKGSQDVLFSATPPPPQCGLPYLSTYMYCHNMQPLILAYILHNNQRLEVVKRLQGGGGVGRRRGICPHAPFNLITYMYPLYSNSCTCTHTQMNVLTQPTYPHPHLPTHLPPHSLIPTPTYPPTHPHLQ